MFLVDTGPYGAQCGLSFFITAIGQSLGGVPFVSVNCSDAPGWVSECVSGPYSCYDDAAFSYVCLNRLITLMGCKRKPYILSTPLLVHPAARCNHRAF